MVELQSRSLRVGRRGVRVNLNEQLVRVIGASPERQGVSARDRRMVLNPEPPSVATRTDHHDARRCDWKTVCADLVALSCEGVLQGRRPCASRFDSAGCAGLIAVLHRAGRAHRSVSWPAPQYSGSPAGGL